MLERFSERAGGVVDRARREAAALGHSWLGAEHLLLALLADEPGAGSVLRGLGVERGEILSEHRAAVGACSAAPTAPPDPDVLAAIGIDLDEVRRRVEESFGSGALEATCAWRRRAALRLTDRAKKVLEVAVHEASALGQPAVQPEHVLLALTRVQESLGWKLVARRGLSARRVRLAVLDALGRTA